MSDDDQPLDSFPSAQLAPPTEMLRTPNGLPDPEPLRRAANLLRVASAALTQVQCAAQLNREASGDDLHKLVYACQQLTTEWIEACGAVESRKQWLAWDALDVLEVIDMAIEADQLAPLERACNTAADLLERLANECEAPPLAASAAPVPEASDTATMHPI